MCAVQVDVDPVACSLPEADATNDEKADRAVSNARASGVPSVMEGADVTKSPKLARLFAAQNLQNQLDKIDATRVPELEALCRYINKFLKDDPPSQKYLPLTAATMLDQLNDGVILSRLVKIPKPDAIDENAIISPSENVSPFEVEDAKRNNAALVLRAAESVGCDVAAVTPENIANGDEEPVVHLLAEVLRLQGLSDLPNRTGPEIDALRLPTESKADFRALPGEVIAARWMGRHLENAGNPPDGRSVDALLNVRTL